MSFFLFIEKVCLCKLSTFSQSLLIYGNNEKQRNIQNRTGTFANTDTQLQTRKTIIIIIITTTIIAIIIIVYLYKLQNKT